MWRRELDKIKELYLKYKEIIDEFETPLGLGQVFVNAGECVE